MNDRLFLVPESDPSLYDQLGVSPQADPETLRQAFRRRSKTLHPDTTTRPADEAARDFQRLREAYELLADPARRRLYDVELQQRQQVVRPLPAERRRDSWDGIGERRPLSGGEWFALLLLGLALLVSLVLGLGVAGVQGRAWQVSPDWLSDAAAATAEHTAEPAFPAGSGGVAGEPRRDPDGRGSFPVESDQSELVGGAAAGA